MNIREKIKKFAEEQTRQGGGGPTALQKLGADAEIVVKGPDGKVKGKYKANNTDITI